MQVLDRYFEHCFFVPSTCSSLQVLDRCFKTLTSHCKFLHLVEFSCSLLQVHNAFCCKSLLNVASTCSSLQVLASCCKFLHHVASPCRSSLQALSLCCQSLLVIAIIITRPCNDEFNNKWLMIGLFKSSCFYNNLFHSRKKETIGTHN